MTRLLQGPCPARNRIMTLSTSVSATFALLVVSSASAQVQLPELPFTSKYGVSARAAGLGYAYGAVAEDGSALWFNPAGLSQIRKMEFSGGLMYESQDRTAGFDTATDDFPGTGFAYSTTTISQTPPTQLTFAYPFPTYRGSLVMAFGYQRLTPLSSDYFREGVLEAPSGPNPGILETESYYEDGGIDFWTFGLAGDLSPKISIGGSVSWLNGDTSQEFEIGRSRLFANGATDVKESEEVFYSRTTLHSDISGWTFSAGVLGRPSEMTRVGVTLFGPESYDFEGFISNEFEDGIYNYPTLDQSFLDQVNLPLSLLFSAAFTPNNLLITGDLRWTDWTQIEFEGPIRNEDRQNAYRATADVSIGAEYQFSGAPARIRAGYSTQPLPYRLMPTDVHFSFAPDDGDPKTFEASSYTRTYDEARFDSGRRFLTVGAGTLIDDALAIDVAYVNGLFERSADDGRWTEKWTTNRIYGTATFRF